jgi:hypothetical protein
VLAGGAYVIIAVAFGIGGGIIGRAKGSSFWVWFMISGVVPIFGLLAAICYRDERRQERRACPGCGRILYVHDTKCMRCGAELYFPEDPAEILPPKIQARS